MEAESDRALRFCWGTTVVGLADLIIACFEMIVLDSAVVVRMDFADRIRLNSVVVVEYSSASVIKMGCKNSKSESAELVCCHKAVGLVPAPVVQMWART